MQNVITQTGERITTGLRIPRELHERLCKRLPKRGQRTAVINALIEKFLDGEVLITSISRKINIP